MARAIAARQATPLMTIGIIIIATREMLGLGVQHWHFLPGGPPVYFSTGWYSGVVVGFGVYATCLGATMALKPNVAGARLGIVRRRTCRHSAS